ncbi:MAG: hydroxyacid dehydrogenase [Micropepsaceae bacterium]
MKLVVFEAEPREASAFDALKAQDDVTVTGEPLRIGNAGRFAEAEVVSTFIYSELNRRVLEQLPVLKLIATRSTGVDHIDTAYCAERGIAVSNVPTYGANTVAEHVFALLLAISHRIIEASQRTRDGRFSPQGLQGFDLCGKTLGVVGTGRIGRHVIRIARGFEMNVIACDINSDAPAAQALGFRYVSFDEVLMASDILTLHVPATPDTQNMIGDRQFERMKDGVVVINTARGGLIDVRALILALRRGKVAAAGLDVLPDEPAIREEAELICSMFCDRHDLRNLVADHVLLKMPNVIVTPHSAFNTREAVQRIIDTTIENIQAFALGRPRNVVGVRVPGRTES